MDLKNFQITKNLLTIIGEGLICFFVFLILVQSCACSAIGAQQRINGPKVITYNVFIPDDFTSEQIIDIKDGIKEWQKSTHESVIFNIIEHYDKQITNTLSIRSNSIIFNNCPVNTSFIIDLDKKLSKEEGVAMIHLGYFKGNTIYIVSERIKNRTDYTGIVEHELGHALGLNHNKKIKTLMYKHHDQASNHITLEDLKVFCTIHVCAWTKTE